MKGFKWILLTFLLVLAPLSALDETPPVRAELIAKEKSIQPGKPFWVAVRLEMQEGWDTYWVNPGDSGFPTEVEWNLPKGFKASALHWPYPERFDNNSLVAFGYKDSVLLLTEITPPSNLKQGEQITLQADVNWLACNESCVPGGASLSLDLPISEGTPQINDLHGADFALTEQLLPKDATHLSSNLAVKRAEGGITLHFTPQIEEFGEIEGLTFIPTEGQVIDYNAPQTVSRGSDGSFVLNLQPHDATEAKTIKGVLLVSEKGNLVKKAIHIDSAGGIDPVVVSVAYSALLGALLFAFLGGMILNVMPCVLPVVALKVFGFVKMADHKRLHVIQHGLFFSIGVVVSFWVLSGLLLILRAYGEGIGWGFQLQEPVFVALLVSVLFLLGLSLFGLFEFGTSLMSLGNKSAGRSPLTSSFMSGVLATLVATPCTGPLLGPAVGFAMTLPAASSLLIFTFVGIGMAFPYLFFSCFPKLVRFLPKAGAWMNTFKQLMGFMMMATVLWLLWVFTAQTDMIALFALLAALVVMSVAAWIYGNWTTPMRKKITRRIATGIAILMIGVSGFYALQVARHSTHLPPPSLSDGGSVLGYSPKLVEDLRKEGKMVFVDFTAKWCLICQANKIVLHSPGVQSVFEENNVVFLEADWTKNDPVITEELQKLGRSGVPVYALYPADLSEKPLILPQTLKSNIINEYIAKATAPKTLVQND